MIDPNPIARPAYTISPVGYESQEDGSLVIQDFDVESSAAREAVHQHNNANYEGNFFEVEETGERYYDNSADNNDYSNIVDSVGGMDAYNSMLAWARNNLSTEDIAAYNEVMDAGDVNDTYDYVQQLAELYYNQTDADNPEEFDEPTNYVFENLMDRESYEDFKDYVRSNYDADFIDNYNLVMDSGNTEMIRNIIRQIQSQISNY